jgi:hypothetical protein
MQFDKLTFADLSLDQYDYVLQNFQSHNGKGTMFGRQEDADRLTETDIVRADFPQAEVLAAAKPL